MAPRVARQVGGTRVKQHQAGATGHGVFDVAGRHRVVGGGVGPHDPNRFGVLHVRYGVADRARAQALEQRGHAGGVAQAGAVVHVRAAQHGAYQFLKHVGFFVAAFGAAQAGQGVATVRGAQLVQRLHGRLQGLFPVHFFKHLAPMRRLLAVGGVFGHTGAAAQRAQ